MTSEDDLSAEDPLVAANDGAFTADAPRVTMAGRELPGAQSLMEHLQQGHALAEALGERCR